MYLALVAKVEGALREAYVRRNEAGIENQSTVAEKLGVNRSVVNRRLTSRHNMTLETVADMAWALGQSVEIDIFDPDERPSNQPRIISEHRRIVSSSAQAESAAGSSAGRRQLRMNLAVAQAV